MQKQKFQKSGEDVEQGKGRGERGDGRMEHKERYGRKHNVEGRMEKGGCGRWKKGETIREKGDGRREK